MKKRFTVLMAGVIAISSFAVGAMSKGVIEKIEAEIRGDFTVVIDGEKQTFRNVSGDVVEPILYEGTTYLPLRAIGEIMGKTVYWYQDEKRIEIVTPSVSDKETLVTDADVIIDSADKTNNADKAKVEKAEKITEVANITLEEAKEIVLKKAGLNEDAVTFIKAKLEKEDNKLVYDIDFKTDAAEYDAEVDASTGDITEWEVEEKAAVETNKTTGEAITVEKAKLIALEKAGLKESEVVFTKAKLDYDHGRAVYEIEFKKGNVEYEAEINAADGTIIEWSNEHH